ncbi:hypothetical protein GQ457_02G035220 [Hibiscus cannabinus]
MQNLVQKGITRFQRTKKRKEIEKKTSNECDDLTITRAQFSSLLNVVHQPGIEPRSVPWQGTILPLDHWCLFV